MSTPDLTQPAGFCPGPRKLRRSRDLRIRNGGNPDERRGESGVDSTGCRYDLARDPDAVDRRRFAWDRGVFAAARRVYTDHVEGTISSSHHMIMVTLIMVTLRGGAWRHGIQTDAGHCYDGPDYLDMTYCDTMSVALVESAVRLDRLS